MAVVWMTGLEAGSIDIFNTSVSSTSCSVSISTANPRTGARHLAIIQGTYGFAYARKVLPDPLTDIYLRFGFALIGGGYFLLFQDQAGSNQLAFYINGSHQIAVYRGATLIATGSIVLPTGTYVCIEIYAKIDDATGVVQIKIDGVLDINFSGDTKNTANANVQALVFGYNTYGYHGSGYYDDILVDDANWPGRGGIHAILPTGAGTYTQLTPSAGANWQCVDEVPPNDNTDYVSDTVIDHKDTYQMSDLVPTSGTIKAIQWNVRAELAVAGSGNIARLIRTGGGDYQGSDVPLDATYRYLYEVLETNPNTSVAWTIADINALEAGLVVR